MRGSPTISIAYFVEKREEPPQPITPYLMEISYGCSLVLDRLGPLAEHIEAIRVVPWQAGSPTAEPSLKIKVVLSGEISTDRIELEENIHFSSGPGVVLRELIMTRLLSRIRGAVEQRSRWHHKHADWWESKIPPKPVEP
jgi:hypothetical protein